MYTSLEELVGAQALEPKSVTPPVGTGEQLGTLVPAAEEAEPRAPAGGGHRSAILLVAARASGPYPDSESHPK